MFKKNRHKTDSHGREQASNRKFLLSKGGESLPSRKKIFGNWKGSLIGGGKRSLSKGSCGQELMGGNYPEPAVIAEREKIRRKFNAQGCQKTNPDDLGGTIGGGQHQKKKKLIILRKLWGGNGESGRLGTKSRMRKVRKEKLASVMGPKGGVNGIEKGPGKRHQRKCRWGEGRAVLRIVSRD